MHRTLVLDVVGLTLDLLGEDTPHLAQLAARGGARALSTVTPAVTCSAQATYVTGLLPREHGIVGNGWYFRELSEIWFWRQSNKLVAGEKVWEAGRRRDPSFTCAKLFWWHNMYSSADWSVTPRPMYPADGRKLPDVYTQPPELRDVLRAALGDFPLFQFWGPLAGIASTRWIAQCAQRSWECERPTLSLVYLPHLDYCLQKYGPAHPAVRPELRQVDALAGELIEQVERSGGRVLVLSEYGIGAVTRPSHPNRALREAGLLHVREELGRELLDPGASDAFAVSDHQLAHVYVRDPSRVEEVRALLEKVDGVEAVWDAEDLRQRGLDHPRSGELVLLARPERWFTYYYWLDDERAPDFARTVDIHRKPGYDPAELFFDPALRLPQLRAAWRLAQKKLGLRALMDVVGLDASVVRGSHGRPAERPELGPLLISSEPALLPEGNAPLAPTEVKRLILEHVFGA
jgi:predicted AlkP superfamily pyrophosphatase or phosphodiesterase